MSISRKSQFTLALVGLGLTHQLLLAAELTPPAGNFRSTFPDRTGDDRLRQQESQYLFPEELPQLEPPSPPSANQQLSEQLRVFVKHIKLTGNTVYSREELSTIVNPYENQELTSEELQALAQALTLFYVNHGYVNSGAILPDQSVDNGEIEIQIIEGRLRDIDVSGNSSLADQYIVNRIKSSDQEVLNLPALQDRLQIFRQNRLISRVNAELRPSENTGESDLDLQIEEAQPYEIGASFNNRRSPSVGGIRGEAFATHYNLTGHADSLTARYGIMEGLDDYGVAYTVPMTNQDTQLKLYFDRSDSVVVEKPFDLLDIRSETEGFGITLWHPFYQTSQQLFSGEIIFEHRASDTYILGTPFAFSLGPKNGHTEINALRLVQEWTDRDLNQIIAARSMFSLGLDAFGATTNPGKIADKSIDPDEIADGQFFSWLGQFQWVTRIANSNSQFIFRSDLQITPDKLLPLEKFAMGGMGTVRGYRENLLVRDNGWVNSVEFRIPLFRLPLPFISNDAEDGWLQIAPFFDIGWSFEESLIKNAPGVITPPQVIHSTGLGLRWDPHQKIHSELYWGYAFRENNEPREHDPLQDNGVHFTLDVRFF